MYLFFDTETTGLPLDWKRDDFEDVDNWPRIVQFAWLVIDSNGNVISGHNFIITPEVEIPEEAAKIHGINTRHAEIWGCSLLPILRLFHKDALRCRHLVAHNIKFDINVVLAEFARFRTILNEQKLEVAAQSRICTMEASTYYCQLPHKSKRPKSSDPYKWPNLQELHNKLFGESFEGAHDAFSDIQATAKCFFEMTKQEIIDFQPPKQ